MSLTGMDTGAMKKTIIPEDAYKTFTESPEVFESFIRLNYDQVIKAGFVFQIQPYTLDLKPFIVHVYPSANGKANDTIISLLYLIRDEVKKRNVNIRSFAFDGDTAYKNIHKMYYESYIRKALKTRFIGAKAKKQIHAVSDFLHLIKRLRYRLLSLIIHAGFDINAIFLDVEKIKKILRSEYPVIWDNNRYTKMHDKLSIEMFKIENLQKLFAEKYYEAAAYWFPISLALLAIDCDDLGYDYRKFFLECAFWFLVFFREPGMFQTMTSSNADIKETTT